MPMPIGKRIRLMSFSYRKLKKINLLKIQLNVNNK